jgi:hypothetical protein
MAHNEFVSHLKTLDVMGLDPGLVPVIRLLTNTWTHDFLDMDYPMVVLLNTYRNRTRT